jgi:plastocyanin
MKTWMVTAGVMLALLGAACGLSSEQQGGGSPSATTTAGLVTPPQPYGEVIGGQVVINITYLKFEPDDVEMPGDTTVIWTNNDKVPHSVTKTSGPGPDFDSGPIQPGGTFQQRFEESGIVRIEDTESSDTTMQLEVQGDDR